MKGANAVSIPQAVSTVATANRNSDVDYDIREVSIPQAVSTVATRESPFLESSVKTEFQYRKR